MPVYQFKCPACGHVIDVLMPADQVDDPKPCPKCHAPMGVVFSPVPRIWKGKRP